jgi:hypothetical protein
MIASGILDSNFIIVELGAEKIKPQQDSVP